MNYTFYDGHDELYHHAKFGEDRTMRQDIDYGCRCENMVFVLFVCWTRSESGAPCVRGVHSSNKHCVAVYFPISTRFSGFFTGDCCFRCTT